MIVYYNINSSTAKPTFSFEKVGLFFCVLRDYKFWSDLIAFVLCSTYCFPSRLSLSKSHDCEGSCNSIG